MTAWFFSFLGWFKQIFLWLMLAMNTMHLHKKKNWVILGEPLLQKSPVTGISGDWSKAHSILKNGKFMNFFEQIFCISYAEKMSGLLPNWDGVLHQGMMMPVSIIKMRMRIYWSTWTNTTKLSTLYFPANDEILHNLSFGLVSVCFHSDLVPLTSGPAW